MTSGAVMMAQIKGLTTINVVWDGPKQITEAFDYHGPTDFGLYALYGTHAVLGPDTLLYVGQSNANPFGRRLKHHYDEWACREPSDVNVYVGRIGGWSRVTADRWGVLIDCAEALTIYFTSPPYNSRGIRELKVQEPMLVLNHKQRHRIPICITNVQEWIDLRDGDFQPYGATGHHPLPSPEAKEHEEDEGQVRRFVGH